MTNNTIFCALALIAIGIYGFLDGQKNAKKEAQEKTAALRVDQPNAAEVTPKDVKTALIPAGFGAALLACAVLVLAREDLRKHVMHLAAMIGLLGIIGGFVPIIRSGEFDLSKPAIKNGLTMSLICAIFVGLCVKSFIDARKAREAKAAS
jgi:H+/Cl- antiporter ClcA